MEAIKQNQPEIKDGYLVGLSEHGDKINLEKLSEIMTKLGTDGIIETLSNTLESIANIQAVLVELRHDDDKAMRNLFDEWICPSMPSGVDITNLNLILKTFNS